MSLLRLLRLFSFSSKGVLVYASSQHGMNQFLFIKYRGASSPCNGNHLLVKRASGATKVFSLVLKTNNCLRLRVLTRNTCLHLVYVSSPGVRILNWRMCPQLAYMSSPGEYVVASNRRAYLSTSPSPSWVCTQKLMHLPSHVQVHQKPG